MLHLHTLWFIVLAVLWVGFFVLEGFDFGVGVLHTIVGRTDTERRVAINTIGPLWDGNEVWLIVAGAGTFAAFPSWYATMFSALYLALLLVLAALIARGVAFEFRGKRDDPRWRRDVDVVHDARQPADPAAARRRPRRPARRPADRLEPRVHRATSSTCSRPTACGRASRCSALCLLHGATFLALRTDGPGARAGAGARAAARLGRDRARGRLRDLDAVGVAATPTSPGPVQVLAVHRGRCSRRACRAPTARAGRSPRSAVAIAATVGSLFIDLYPNVMVSSTNAAYDLTVEQRRLGGLRAEGDDDRHRRAASPSCCSTRAGPSTCSAGA